MEARNGLGVSGDENEVLSVWCPDVYEMRVHERVDVGNERVASYD